MPIRESNIDIPLQCNNHADNECRYMNHKGNVGSRQRGGNGRNSGCRTIIHNLNIKEDIREIRGGGARCSVVVKALCYKPEGRGSDTR
jgi:hypothetical protein